jgi:hypothetical protein
MRVGEQWEKRREVVSVHIVDEMRRHQPWQDGRRG